MVNMKNGYALVESHIVESDQDDQELLIPSPIMSPSVSTHVMMTNGKVEKTKNGKNGLIRIEIPDIEDNHTTSKYPREPQKLLVGKEFYSSELVWCYALLLRFR